MLIHKRYQRPLAVGATLLAIVSVVFAWIHLAPSHIPPAVLNLTQSSSLSQVSAENPPPEWEAMSPDARQMTRWIAASDDANGNSFVIIDKRHAQLYVLDGKQRLQAATPVLLGSAKGDDTVPGIGARPIEEVRPEERTTPAGRFDGERGRNLRGEDVVWVDYDAGVSMHRVLTTTPAERRLERLATPTPADNRISYGCINVPVEFFDRHISPIFAARKTVVYIIPEEKTIAQVFGPVPARYASDTRDDVSEKGRAMAALVALLLARRVSP